MNRIFLKSGCKIRYFPFHSRAHLSFNSVFCRSFERNAWTLKLIRLKSQCWSGHLQQPGCWDRTLQDAELPATHPKPDRHTGLRQNHPGSQIFTGAKMLCLGSKAWLARAAVEPWCTKGTSSSWAGAPTQPRDLYRAAAMPWLIHSRELFNPTAAFPVQQLATGVTGGYY